MDLLRRTGTDVLVGAVLGGGATLPMSVVMLAAQRAGLMGTLPPRRLTDAAVAAVQGDVAAGPGTDGPDEPTRRALTTLTHLGFGAVAGVPFVLAHRVLPERLPPEAVGVGYALGVWASAYLGWVPALGIMARADRDRPDRQVSMVLAHVVYGAVLGAGVRWCRPRG